MSKAPSPASGQSRPVKIVGHLNVPGRLAASALGALCQEPSDVCRDADRQEGKETRDQLGRRDRQRHRAHPRRRDRSSEFQAEDGGVTDTNSIGPPGIDANTTHSGARPWRAPEELDPFVAVRSVVAVFVGYFVVWAVTPALHTPLMSVTNAIASGIVVVAFLAVVVALAGDQIHTAAVVESARGFVALMFASDNILGGIVVTESMLAVHQKRRPNDLDLRKCRRQCRGKGSTRGLRRPSKRSPRPPSKLDAAVYEKKQ